MISRAATPDELQMIQDTIRADSHVLKYAPYYEHLLRCELWLKVGEFAYRPKDGWPLCYAYGRTE